MRAWDFLNEGAEPPISVQHLNDAKQQERDRAASRQGRVERTRPMYANTAWQGEQLELERGRLELEQLRLEIAAAQANARADNDMVIAELAKSRSKAKSRNQQHVQKLAQAEILRQKKS